MHNLGQKYRQARLTPSVCSICGTSDTVTLFEGDRHGLGLSTVLCVHCGLGYLSPRPEDQWFDDFYRTEYWPLYLNSEWSQQFEEGKRRGEQLLKVLQPYIPISISSFLDFGCGAGGTLAVFSKEYPHAECIGVEPSDSNVAALKQVAEVLVVREVPPRKFDFMLTTHVLEHDLDPMKTMQRLSDALTDEGMLYVEVPDLLSYAWKGQEFFHIAHVNYFTDVSLRALVEKAGLFVVKTFRGTVDQWPWSIGILCGKHGEHSAAKRDVKRDWIRDLQQHVAAQTQDLNGTGDRSFATHPGLLAKLGRLLERISPRTKKAASQLLSVARGELNLQITELEHRIGALERLVDTISSSPDASWLYRNREERMDATVAELFDPRRRKFHLARYEFAAQRVPGKDVVDVASGTGYGSSLLGKCGAKTVTGIDIDPEAVGYATRRFATDNVKFLSASGDATPLAAESADVVVSFETIEHVPDDRAFLKELHRILRPGGMFICSTPNEWPLEIAAFHTREYSRQSFEAVVSEFFELEEMWNQNSGSPSLYNHDQPAGMCLTTAENEHLAECFVCVARKKAV